MPSLDDSVKVWTDFLIEVNNEHMIGIEKTTAKRKTQQRQGYLGARRCSPVPCQKNSTKRLPEALAPRGRYPFRLAR